MYRINHILHCIYTLFTVVSCFNTYDYMVVPGEGVVLCLFRATDWRSDCL
jgi:hypothetical protein